MNVSKTIQTLLLSLLMLPATSVAGESLISDRLARAINASPSKHFTVQVDFVAEGRTRGPVVSVQDWSRHTAAMRGVMDGLIAAGDIAGSYDGGLGWFTIRANAKAVRKLANWEGKFGVRITKIDFDDSPEAKVWEGSDPRPTLLPNERVPAKTKSGTRQWVLPEFRTWEGANPRPVPLPNEKDAGQNESPLGSPEVQIWDEAIPRPVPLPNDSQAEASSSGPRQWVMPKFRTSDDVETRVDTAKSSQQLEPKTEKPATSADTDEPDAKLVYFRLSVRQGDSQREKLVKESPFGVKWLLMDERGLVGKTTKAGFEKLQELAKKSETMKCEQL